MCFNIVKIITLVLCIDKFWKIYEVFIRIWSLFWKILGFISIVFCSKEFNLFLGVVWINVLLWINGCMFWYEIYRIDYSVYLLFGVIFSDFTTECVLSCLIISKPWIASYRNQLQLVYEVSELLLCCWSWCFM